MPLIARRRIVTLPLLATGTILFLQYTSQIAAKPTKKVPAQVNQSPARVAVEARYARYVKALKAKDMATISSMEAADFVHKWAGESHTRTQSDALLRQQLAKLKTIQDVKLTIKQWSQQGDQATVQANQYLKATFQDEKGKTHTLINQGDTHDIWVKKANDWFIQSTEELKGETTIDGLKVP